MIIDSPRPEHLPHLRALWKQAFGDEDVFLDKFYTYGFSPERCRCFFDKNKPVAVLYWFDATWEEKKLAYLYAVATDKAYQGQGLCRRLMKNTHRHLCALGYTGAILVPGSESLFAFYGKMGYLPCSFVDRFTCQAGAAIPLQKINSAEYARLRRNYLPQGSVQQEDETLAFLSSFADFYKGENCLFCGTAEDGAFHAQEFLGDASQAPSALSSLDLEKGNFRTPGQGTPLAMFYPFAASETLPFYFGIPLD